MRATSRMCDASINTVTKLLVDVGAACDVYLNETLRNLPCKRIQCDEIWSFCYAKERNVPEGKRNEFGYAFIPKLTGDHSQLPMTLAMLDGVMKGQFIIGQNPVVGAVNSDLVERGLSRLEWLVVRDFAMTETINSDCCDVRLPYPRRLELGSEGNN